MTLERISVSQVRCMEAPEWLVDGIVPDGGLCMLFGPEGSHKTFFAMDLSCCVASGIGFHGRAVKQGRVLYIAAEGGTPIAKRLRAWEAEHGCVIDDSALAMVMEPLILDDLSQVDDAIAELKRDAERYVLIVIDTLNMCMLGNESSAHEVAQVIRAAKRFTALFGSAVLIVHHTPKENPNTHRGSGALSAGLTTNMKVYFDGHDTTSVSCVKQKDHEPFETMVFRHHEVGESLVLREVEDAHARSGAAARTQNMTSTIGHPDTMLTIVADHPDGLSRRDLVAMAIAAGISQSAAYRCVTRLEMRRHITIDEDGVIRPN